MAEIMSWDVSDELWARVEPLVPKGGRDTERLYRRKPGGGRKPTRFSHHLLENGFTLSSLPLIFTRLIFNIS
jgi:hypothetical protein